MTNEIQLGALLKSKTELLAFCGTIWRDVDPDLVGDTTQFDLRAWDFDGLRLEVCCDRDGALQYIMFEMLWGSSESAERREVDRLPQLVNNIGLGDPVDERLLAELTDFEALGYSPTIDEGLFTNLSLGDFDIEVSF